MITVHHLNNSRSQRILWLLEELGLEYDIKRYERNPDTMLAPDSLRKVHPLGKSPVITDGELTLAESGAIVEYLVGHYGNGALIPASDTKERLRYTYWLHYAEGSAMPPLLLKLVLNKMEEGTPAFLRFATRAITGAAKRGFVDPQITLHLDYVNAELAKNTWFTGDEFTAADIQMSFPLEEAAANGEIDPRRSASKGFFKPHSRSPSLPKSIRTRRRIRAFAVSKQERIHQRGTDRFVL